VQASESNERNAHMKSLPATTVALGVAGTVGYALYLFHNPWCLLGLVFMGAVKYCFPVDPDVAKARYEAAARSDEAFYGNKD